MEGNEESYSGSVIIKNGMKERMGAFLCLSMMLLGFNLGPCCWASCGAGGGRNAPTSLLGSHYDGANRASLIRVPIYVGDVNKEKVVVGAALTGRAGGRKRQHLMENRRSCQTQGQNENARVRPSGPWHCDYSRQTHRSQKNDGKWRGERRARGHPCNL